MFNQTENGLRLRIRTWLPTGIPGVSMRMRGRARYRTDQHITRTERHPLRLAAALSVHHIASALTTRALLWRDHDISDRVSLALADWHRSPHPKFAHLEVKARVRLWIARTDQSKIDDYQADRRLQHVKLAVLSDQLHHISSEVLSSTENARAWWLRQHGTSPESWDTFDRLFLPLVKDSGGPQDSSTKIAFIIASAIRRIEDKPADHAELLRTTAAILRLYRQGDLAEDLSGNGKGNPDREHSPDQGTLAGDRVRHSSQNGHRD
ncbi:hypothetical protein [Nocardiopsis deserti]|uniref:hypothetical protein n=1 Tax=Nocardiopsis deserti TaxID=2605988 RepID=UPI001238A861|nr:hypothetical protein [Nocardiopsis deserti]